MAEERGRSVLEMIDPEYRPAVPTIAERNYLVALRQLQAKELNRHG